MTMEHWLQNQVERLLDLAERAPARGAGLTRSDDPRRALLAAVRELVEAVVTRAGVTAAVACFEGLPVAAAGRVPMPTVEAVAAMSQRLLDVGVAAVTPLTLGAMRQLVLVGEKQKVALLVFGPLAVAILSPTEVELAHALSR